MHSSIIVPDKNLERCTLISQPHTTDTAVFLPSPYQYLQSNQKTFSDSGQIVRAVFLPAHRSNFRDRSAESILMEKGKCTSREGNTTVKVLEQSLSLATENLLLKFCLFCAKKKNNNKIIQSVILFVHI